MRGSSGYRRCVDPWRVGTFDGRPRSDGRGQWCHPVPAARRLPAPRQDRGDHLPRARSVVVATTDIVGAHRRPPVGQLRHRWQDAARPRPTGRARADFREGRAIALDARWWWYSPTAGLPPGRIHWTAVESPRPGWPLKALPRWLWTARRQMCGWGWPTQLAGQRNAPAVRLEELRADHLTRAVRSVA